MIEKLELIKNQHKNDINYKSKISNIDILMMTLNNGSENEEEREQS